MVGDLTRASGASDTSPNAQCEDCFDSWCLGATYRLLPAAHNVAEKRIDFKRFICFGINRAREGNYKMKWLHELNAAPGPGGARTCTAALPRGLGLGAFLRRCQSHSRRNGRMQMPTSCGLLIGLPTNSIREVALLDATDINRDSGAT